MTATKLDAATICAYQVLCGFLGRQLYLSPRASDISNLVEQRELLLNEPFLSLNPEASKALNRELFVATSSKKDVAPLLARLSLDFTYLFKMVGLSHTSPYESVYRTNDRTVFGPTTLAVRQVYAAYGFGLVEQGREPDDHIGLELLFVEHLLSCLVDSKDANMVDALRSFLEEHLLVFGPDLLAHIKLQAQTPYFRAIAELGESLLESLCSWLECKPATHAAR